MESKTVWILISVKHSYVSDTSFVLDEGRSNRTHGGPGKDLINRKGALQRHPHGVGGYNTERGLYRDTHIGEVATPQKGGSTETATWGRWLQHRKGLYRVSHMG